MGENSFLPLHAESQPGSRAAPHSPINAIDLPNGTAAHLNGDEEPYTIKCVCGFDGDDGNTVLCEQCETWQHIECYYFPTLKVPDVHKCLDCFPRELDTVGATQRQRLLRDSVNANEDRKTKRSAPKGHKRSKTKDPAAHPNGWSNNDGHSHDRASGSPRDHLPPPSKRPKTTHKNSASVSANASTASAGHRQPSGPQKPALADCPPDYFSPEFIHIHQTNTDFNPTQANIFLNIAISDQLSRWLDDEQAFADATNGKSHADVFKQHPTIEDFETTVEKRVHRDTTAKFHGSHPVWPYLVSDRRLYAGDFIGELSGSIGHLDEYKADPANRWDRLRHPDHFVFFHPQLPIYIDCRSDGTVMRFARRSCRPNMQMETIITPEREYHFCFVARTDIPENAEVTIGWDPTYDEHLRDYLYRLSSSESLDATQKGYLANWVETVLAHFGGCACNSPYDGVCLMERFDRRMAASEPLTQPVKTSRKRPAPKRSPPTDQAENSRAGSEAVAPGDQGEDGEDGRSTSRSSQSPTSREDTPATHPNDKRTREGPELSMRDRRKLQQQEKLFEKIEQEEQGQRKKKRRSGSHANTPSAVPSGKQTGRSSSASNPNTPAPASKSRASDGHETSYFNVIPDRSPTDNSPHPLNPLYTRNSIRRTGVANGPSQPPVYTDASTQTEPEDGPNNASSRPPPERKPYMPLSQRLLRRNHLRRIKNAGDYTKSAHPIHDSGSQDVVMSDSTTPGSMFNDAGTSTGGAIHQLTDVEMKDSDSSGLTNSASPAPAGFLQQQPQGDPSAQPNTIEPGHPSSVTATSLLPTELPEPRHKNNYRSANLHVDLPPPQFLSNSATTSPALNTGDGAAGQVLQSPQSAVSASTPSAPVAPMSAPILNPAVSTLAQPSPAKKKLSLSDYSQRLKAKTPATEKSQGFGDLAAVSPSATKQPAPAFADRNTENVPPPLSPSSTMDGVEVKKETEMAQ